LFPKGLAMPATAGNLRRVESLRKKREASLAAQLEDAKAAVAQLVKQSYTITAAAGEDGKLYGSVTAADISEALKKEGIEVDRRKIVLEHPIRELGVYDVDVKLHPDVVTKVKIWVVGPDGEKCSRGRKSAARTKKLARRHRKPIRRNSRTSFVGTAIWLRPTLSHPKLPAKQEGPALPGPQVRKAVASLGKRGGSPLVLDRVLPNSLDAEMAVLGAMLLSPAEAGSQVRERLSENHFYYAAHQVIFREIAALQDAMQGSTSSR
jgi:large subunit ribosomal protein L9